ncbi:MAG: DegV family protein [Tissierellia bacterium]|nr:DegV family protein [Tissierellia bacterium]
MKVRIVTDSTADFSPEIKDRLTIVPLTIKFEEEEFIDGVTINKKDFYEKLKSSDLVPTTSQPTPLAFRNKYEELIEDGCEFVVLTISSKLSGTYQSAIIASEGLEDKVFVVDSKTASIGEGILLELAVNLIDEGKSAKEVAEILEKEKDNVTLVALIDTLDYLLKGGRISKSSAMIGTLLSVKLVFTLDNGEIQVLGKARGLKNAKNLLTSQIGKAGEIDFEKPYLLGYTGLDDKNINQYIDDAKYIWEGNIERPKYTCLGSVIGTHAGPGALAVAFFNKSDKKQI